MPAGAGGVASGCEVAQQGAQAGRVLGQHYLLSLRGTDRACTVCLPRGDLKCEYLYLAALPDL